jgi:hypothetical protein
MVDPVESAIAGSIKKYYFFEQKAVIGLTD